MALKELLAQTKRSPDSPLTQLDRHLMSLASKGRREEDGKIHPSALSDCARQEVYRKLGLHFGEPISPRVRRIFDNGHGLHYRLHCYLRDMGVLEGNWECGKCHHKYWDGPGLAECPKCKAPLWDQEYKEVQVENEELNVIGHTDGVCHFPGLPKMLAEFKSINSNGWKQLIQPMEKHIEQATIYMKCLGIMRTMFWYENKDNQEIKEYVVPFSPVMWARLDRRMCDIRDGLSEKVLPDRICETAGCARAVKCDHKEMCFSDADFKDILTMTKKLA